MGVFVSFQYLPSRGAITCAEALLPGKCPNMAADGKETLNFFLFSSCTPRSPLVCFLFSVIKLPYLTQLVILHLSCLSGEGSDRVTEPGIQPGPTPYSR